MANKARPMTTATGSCLCGSVQYSVTGWDRGPVLCHCRNCQTASGSAFAYNNRFLRAQLTFPRGGDLVREYADKATKTGNTLFRHFCVNCGTPLYLRNEAFEGLVVLHVGGMREGGEGEVPAPGGELFEENRRGWLAKVEEKAKAKI